VGGGGRGGGTQGQYERDSTPPLPTVCSFGSAKEATPPLHVFSLPHGTKLNTCIPKEATPPLPVSEVEPAASSEVEPAARAPLSLSVSLSLSGGDERKEGGAEASERREGGTEAERGRGGGVMVWRSQMSPRGAVSKLLGQGANPHVLNYICTHRETDRQTDT
jgi:hypothetical protein